MNKLYPKSVIFFMSLVFYKKFMTKTFVHKTMICYKSHALMVNKSHVYRHIMKGAPLIWSFMVG